MKRKVVAVSLVSVVLGISVVGCGTGGANSSGTSGGASNSTSNSNNTSYKVQIGTATTTGVFYPFGAELAKVWSNSVPGVKATSEVTNGSVQNINLMEQGSINVAFTTVDVLKQAYDGTGAFNGHPYKDVRVLAGLYPSVAQLVVKKGEGINSVTNLKGKSFVPGAPGSSTKVVADAILSAYGMSESDVHAQYVGFTNAVALMKNGQADGAFQTAGIPTSAVQQMLTTANAKLLGLSDTAISKLVQKYPYYYKYTIAANSYDKQTSPVNTIAQNVMLVVPKSMPEQEAYELTKALWQNIGSIGQTVSAAKNGKLANATQGLGGVPLDSGAKKYYQEQGVLK